MYLCLNFSLNFFVFISSKNLNICFEKESLFSQAHKDFIELKSMNQVQLELKTRKDSSYLKKKLLLYNL